jgi:hypothetical protein
MSDRDPHIRPHADPALTRQCMARETQHAMLAHVAAKTTDTAAGPLPLHKNVRNCFWHCRWLPG